MLIGAAAPALDLVLSVGDRVSRAIASGERDYYPIRAPSEAFELGAVPGDEDASRRPEPVD